MKNKKPRRTIYWDLLYTVVAAVCAFLLTVQDRSVFSYALSPARMALLLSMVCVPVGVAFKRGEKSLARCIAILSPALMILFFSMPSIITFDTAHYLSYLPILNGEIGYENWDIVRGPVFPTLIHIACKVFGHSVRGSLSIQYLTFTASLFCILYIVRHVEKRQDVGLGTLVLVALFFCLNPLIQGGYHAFLTEYVAAFAVLLSCVVSWKWIFVTGRITIKDVKYAVYYVFASTIMWQLKQPWMGCVIYPLIAVIICSFINRGMRAKLRAAFRLVVLAICLVSMLVSTILWDSYIGSFGNLNKKRTSEGLTARLLTETLPIRFVEELDAAQAAQLYPTNVRLEADTRYSVYQLYTLKDGALPQYMLIKTDNQGGIASSLKLMLNCWITYPKQVIEQYALNYLKICNILASDPQRVNKPSLQLQKGSGDENQAIYYRMLNYNDNVFWVNSSLEDDRKPFIATFPCAEGWKKILSSAVNLADWLFKSITTSTIIVWLFLLFRIVRMRNGLDEHPSLIMHFVIWTFCIVNILFHTILGTTIDRYVFPNYMLGCLSLAMALNSFLIRICKRKYQEGPITAIKKEA